MREDETETGSRATNWIETIRTTVRERASVHFQTTAVNGGVGEVCQVCQWMDGAVCRTKRCFCHQNSAVTDSVQVYCTTSEVVGFYSRAAVRVNNTATDTETAKKNCEAAKILKEKQKTKQNKKPEKEDGKKERRKGKNKQLERRTFRVAGVSNFRRCICCVNLQETGKKINVFYTQKWRKLDGKKNKLKEERVELRCVKFETVRMLSKPAAN